MNLEILLINTLIISAIKVQTVIDKFMKNKTYTSAFCFTGKREKKEALMTRKQD